MQQAHRMQLGLLCLRVPSLRAQAPLLTTARACPGAAKGAAAATVLLALLAGFRVSPVIAAVLAVCLVMLGVAVHLASWVLAKDEGTPEMQEASSCVCNRSHACPAAAGHLRARCAANCETRRASHAKQSRKWCAVAVRRSNTLLMAPDPAQISQAIRDGAEGYFATQVTSPANQRMLKLSPAGAAAARGLQADHMLFSSSLACTSVRHHWAAGGSGVRPDFCGLFVPAGNDRAAGGQGQCDCSLEGTGGKLPGFCKHCLLEGTGGQLPGFRQHCYCSLGQFPAILLAGAACLHRQQAPSGPRWHRLLRAVHHGIHCTRPCNAGRRYQPNHTSATDHGFLPDGSSLLLRCGICGCAGQRRGCCAEHVCAQLLHVQHMD